MSLLRNEERPKLHAEARAPESLGCLGKSKLHTSGLTEMLTVHRKVPTLHLLEVNSLEPRIPWKLGDVGFSGELLHLGWDFPEAPLPVE
jgi:hypothetical protein